jgi:hypothetical protein
MAFNVLEVEAENPANAGVRAFLQESITGSIRLLRRASSISTPTSNSPITVKKLNPVKQKCI